MYFIEFTKSQHSTLICASNIFNNKGQYGTIHRLSISTFCDFILIVSVFLIAMSWGVFSMLGSGISDEMIIIVVDLRRVQCVCQSIFKMCACGRPLCCHSTEYSQYLTQPKTWPLIKKLRNNDDEFLHLVCQLGDYSKYKDRRFSWRIYECKSLFYNHSLFWWNESEPQRPPQK